MVKKVPIILKKINVSLYFKLSKQNLSHNCNNFFFMKIDISNFKYYLKLNKKTSYIISLFYFIYLFIRAITVPFLHDEIMTYWFYINTGNFLPFLYKIDINGANNHILNTLLSYSFYKLFGFTPFVLRLANLILIPFYCFFAFKISNTLKNKHIALLLWLCLILIHPIIDFLALSRGYGMSFTLLLGSIWYLILTFKKNSIKNYLLSSLLITTSISANLSLMNSGIIIIGFLILHILIKKNHNKNKILKLSSIFITGILPITFWAIYSFDLQKAGALYYGTHDGFWIQSVTSICKALFNTQNHLILFGIFFYFLLIILLSIIYLKKNYNSINNLANLIFPALLLGNIIAVLLLAKYFNVNYPEDRSGFHFYYFFIGAFFFIIDKFIEKFEFRRLSWLLTPFILIPIYFITQINFTHISVYKEDRIPYHFYKTIIEKTKNSEEIATIGSYFGRTLVFAYHNYLNKGNIAKSHDSDYPSIIPDYLLINPKDFEASLLYYTSIDSDKVTGYHLLERKSKLERKCIAEFANISTNGNTNNEFFNLSEGKIDTLIETPLFFEYNMEIQSEAVPFEAWVVVSVSDSLGNQTAYEYIPLNWFKPNWNNDNKHFNNGQLLTNLPATSYKYVTYIWNINKVNFKIEKASVKIKKLIN